MITPVVLCKSISPPARTHMHTCMHMPLWLTRLFVAFLWPKQANAACLRLYAPSHTSPDSNQPHRERERERGKIRQELTSNARMEVCGANEKGGGALIVWEGVWSSLSLPNTCSVSKSHTPPLRPSYTRTGLKSTICTYSLNLESINRCYKCYTCISRRF